MVFLRMLTKTKTNIIKSECMYCIMYMLYTGCIFMSAGYPAGIFFKGLKCLL